VEAIHVQLPDEGGVIVVLEEFGNQRLGKLVLVEDNERITRT
jgi:hypothetical protein